MKKKLLVTASTFPRWEGDTEPRFILDLCKALNEYFDITVLVPACPGAKEEEILEGVKVMRYHYFPIHKWETLCYPGAIVPRIKEKKIRVLLVPFVFLGLWMRLHRIINDFDVAHAHWIIPQGIVQSFFKKPYIITGHGGDVTSLNFGIIKHLKIRCLSRAQKVTVVSNALKRTINEMVPNVSVLVQSMGCDLKKFSQQNKVNNFFSQNDKKVALFVGRFAEKKGVKYLIEAVKKIDILLVIVGSGPLETELRNQAKKYRDKIIFLGPKSHNELPIIYASADLFVAPSITAADGDKEGVPTTIIEAMASGLPVVASNSSGIPEIVQDGYNGFLTEEKDVEAIGHCIRNIIENSELSSRLSKNAIKTAEKYSYDKVGKMYTNIINGDI